MLALLRRVAAGYSAYKLVTWSMAGGIAFLAIAGFLALKPLIGAALAAVCAGAGLLLLAALACLFALGRGRQAKPSPAKSNNTEQAMLDTLLDEQTAAWVRRNALPVTLGALAAGFAAGASPAARKRMIAMLETLLDEKRDS